MGNFGRFGTLTHFISHIGNMGAASGGKRVYYALMNIIWMAVGVAAAIGAKFLIEGTFYDGFINLILGIIGVIICIAVAVVSFLEGFLAQFVLVFMSGIGMRNPEERKGNAVAFVISLITSLGLVAAGIVILMII